MSNPGALDYPAINGRVVTEAHAQICRERGHATHTVDNVVQGSCPRCGEVNGWPQTRGDQLVWACCVSTIGGPCAHKRHMADPGEALADGAAPTGTEFDAVICAHGGSVIKTYPDDAYVHVTVQFPDFPQREAFLDDLPSHVDWERRTPPCQVVLHVERTDT